MVVPPMLYAILICTDEACAEELEAWGEAEELCALGCESCGCVLQPLSFCEVSAATVTALPRRTPYVQQRRAA